MSVEADTVDDAVMTESTRWHGKVLPQAGNVGEAQIDHLDVGPGIVVKERWAYHSIQISSSRAW
jgi:hypothetical protein